MVQIGEVLVSFDIFEKKFCCDLDCCKGICCIEGDYGAPLSEGEIEKLRKNYVNVRSYMKPEGCEAVALQGFAVKDCDNEWTTPLIAGRECAFAIEEGGSCWCAVEKAWTEGKSDFRKPESCHLYPIRIACYAGFEALNYHKWKVCQGAVLRGEKEGIPLYRFLKEALIARYGEEWYEELEYAAAEYEAGRLVQR